MCSDNKEKHLLRDQTHFSSTNNFVFLNDLPVFHKICDHDDQINFLLPNHFPKVVDGGRRGPLRRDVRLFSNWALNNHIKFFVCVFIRRCT